MGIFYGVGVGPGDPELLTLKALKVIREADVIIAPVTEKNENSIALGIAGPYLSPRTEIVPLVFPMVFQPEELSDAWRHNKAVILEFLEKGRRVVFLTLGDPMLYSTYLYIYRLLQGSGHPLITIPGIPAFCAIAGRTGFPLADGNDIISILPATCRPEDLEQAAQLADSLVLMKVSKNYDRLIGLLKESGYHEAVMVSKCGLADEETVWDLESAAGKPVSYLSTILARKVKKER